MFGLYSAPLEEAKEIYEEEVERYNLTYEKTNIIGQQLYQLRLDSQILLKDVCDFINSIANKPKTIGEQVEQISIESQNFEALKNSAEKILQEQVKVGVAAGTGIAGGAAVAAGGPAAAMWVATTFGVASTGTPIAALSGAVAQNAALAWLGGGSLAAGGAGMAGGKAFLLLAGPVGLGIAGASAAIGVVIQGNKNKKATETYMRASEEVVIRDRKLRETFSEIEYLAKETEREESVVKQTLAMTIPLKGKNYITLSDNEKTQLGTLVNHALALAEMMNKKIEA